MKNANLILLFAVTLLLMNCKPSRKVATDQRALSQQELVLENRYDSVSYVWGINFADFLQSYHYTEIDLELMKKGFSDAFYRDSLPISIEEVKEIIRNYGQFILDTEVALNDSIGRAWMKEYALNEGVKSLPSGILYEVLSEGWVEKKVIPGDRVVVHYHTWLVDGTLVDSSIERMKPYDFAFGVSSVIKGWEEIIPLMNEGDKFKVVIPQELAYGDESPTSLIPPGSTLIYELKILDIKSIRD